MTELYLIIPYCCITRNYYTYNSAFAEGYMIGIASMLIIVMLYMTMRELIEVCKGASTVESDNEEEDVEIPENEEEESLENPEDQEEQDDKEEKSEEDKKDD